MRVAGSQIGVALTRIEADSEPALEAAFETARRDRVSAMVMPPAVLYLAKTGRIVELSRKHRIATCHQNRAAVELGALASYGIDFTDGLARTALYVDKILKGAKPGDLPVEQADRFQSAVNRTTAKAFGLQIPQTVLARVDEVIE